MNRAAIPAADAAKGLENRLIEKEVLI